MNNFFRISAIAFYFLISGVVSGRAEINETKETHFIFIGHHRGPDNFKINNLLPYFVKDIRHLKKDFVLASGDAICGYRTAYDKQKLRKEWDLIDRYFNAIGVPVYRVASNHDWHSLATKEVFNERYGREYFAFQKNNVLIIGLHVMELFPDTVDWAKIWDHAKLPNEDGVIPKGEQWDFLTDKLSRAAGDASIDHIVIFMSSVLWKQPDTQQEWWARVHPFLVKNGKVRLVLGGDSSGIIKSDRRDNISYVVSGVGIVEEDQDFSLTAGTYLQVAFTGKDPVPDILVHVINLRLPQYLQLVASVPSDTEPYMHSVSKKEKGQPLSLATRVRIPIKRWMVRNIDWFDPKNNLIVLSGFFGIAALVAVLIVKIRR